MGSCKNLFPAPPLVVFFGLRRLDWSSDGFPWAELGGRDWVSSLNSLHSPPHGFEITLALYSKGLSSLKKEGETWSPILTF